MKCKKAIMGLSALLVVMFHFYSPLSKSPWELTLFKAAFVGVDMFFFVSAYSLSQRKSTSYWSFLKNRIKSVYLPFVVLSIICAVYKSWDLTRFLTVISGVEFFKRGGGAFLWFDVAIMLVYLVAPGIAALKKKLGLKFLPMALAAWAALVLLLQYGFNYTTIFIMLNRLPFFFLGLYYQELRDWLKEKPLALPLILLGLAAGGYLIYNWAGLKRLNQPIKEFYYIVAIPFTLALIGLFDYVTTKWKLRFRILEFVGGFSFELYGLQMIFGFTIKSKIANALKQTALTSVQRGFVSFLLTTLILILMAFVFSKVRTIIMNLSKKKEN